MKAPKDDLALKEEAMILLTKARSNLIRNDPFFGTLSLRLKLVAAPEMLDTAGVDGEHFFFNPKFVIGLSAHELRGLVAHEVLHCVFQHMNRRMGRDPETWNVACDYAINGYLRDGGYILPHGGIMDTNNQFTPGDSSESIYNKIKKDPPPACKWGLVLDAPDGTSKTVEVGWEIAVRAAASNSKMAGKLSGSLAAAISEVVRPIVDWRSLLWPFCTNLADENYSWSRPNRAYISEDEYLPSRRSEALGPIAVCVDTSGSISDADLTQFWGEICDIARNLRPSTLVLVMCDSEVHSIQEIDIDEIENTPMKMLGRGGTRFSPAIKAVVDKYPDMEALVYLTDMECDDSGEAPYFPVLWVSTSSNYTDPPFGEACYMAPDYSADME